MFEGADEYGFDWSRISAEAGARLGDRSADALYEHFRERHPDKFREMREANPINYKKGAAWTEEEVEALKRGGSKHGADFNKILETENEILGRRTVNALSNRYFKIK